MSWSNLVGALEGSKRGKMNKATAQSVAQKDKWLKKSRNNVTPPISWRRRTKAEKLARQQPAKDAAIMQTLMSLPHIDSVLKHIILGSQSAVKEAATDPIAYLADYLRQVADVRDRKQGNCFNRGKKNPFYSMNFRSVTCAQSTLHPHVFHRA